MGLRWSEVQILSPRPFKTMGYGLGRSPFFVWGGIWGGKWRVNHPHIRFRARASMVNYSYRNNKSFISCSNSTRLYPAFTSAWISLGINLATFYKTQSDYIVPTQPSYPLHLFPQRLNECWFQSSELILWSYWATIWMARWSLYKTSNRISVVFFLQP